MTRKEKIDEAQKLENEIKELESFMYMLEAHHTIHPSQRLTSTYIKQTIQTSYFGLWKNGRSIQIRIPDKMILEIAAKCRIWIDELENRSNELVVGD